MACRHTDFVAHVRFDRITDDGTDTEELIGLYAAVSAVCAACGEPVRFRGLPLGLNPRHPTVEIGHAIVNLPAYFAGVPLLGLDGPTVSVEWGSED